MIPKFVEITGVWRVLPPGIHDATLDEIEGRFAINLTRKRIFEGLKRGIDALRKAGCKVVYLDGSFVSEKDNPGDFDACWEVAGVDDKALEPVLLDFSEMRKNQKLKYAGEFFPASAKADGTRTFLEYFQKDKQAEKTKGIIRIQL